MIGGKVLALSAPQTTATHTKLDECLERNRDPSGQRSLALTRRIADSDGQKRQQLRKVSTALTFASSGSRPMHYSLREKGLTVVCCVSLEVLIFEEKGKLECAEKNLPEQGENQQQCQPT